MMMVVIRFKQFHAAVDNVTFREHKFSVSDLPAFTAFSLKVVITGTN